jgi:4-hydroxybenzoyl-CoA thioesterase/acyl-CoA thioester hydrolase
MHEFRTRRKIEFADTDMEGIVHFSRFMIFMETAEHEFLEAIGTSVALDLGEQRLGWPRVRVSCEYASPARFGDLLDIRLQVLRKGVKSMTYRFDFDIDGRHVATGEVTSACCELNADGGIRAIPIPAFIADKIEEVPS